MAARISAAMQAALKLYDKRKAGDTVRDIATRAGVSFTGLYAAIKARENKQ